MFPVMLRVPVPLCVTAPVADVPEPPEIAPTMLAEFGELPVYDKHELVDPANTEPVSVMLLLSVNEPPAVAEFALSVRISATVVLTFSVMAKLLAISTSDDVNVENTSLAAPLGVVAHTSTALTLPALRA
jgi:hypothetical protein